MRRPSAALPGTLWPPLAFQILPKVHRACSMATREKDIVTFEVLYCGICHTDLHKTKNEWGNAMYPMVPGHQIAGVVTEVGSKVTKFKVRDKVRVGCLVGSCHSCDSCASDLENYCPRMILTYNSKYYDGSVTYGGYSNIMVADEHFVVAIPDHHLQPIEVLWSQQAGAPPRRSWAGGLGHMAVKLTKAMGLKVTVISTSPDKKEEALDRLVADSFLVSRDHEEMQGRWMLSSTRSQCLILDLLPLLDLLKSHGKLVMVGAPDKPLELPAFPLLMGRKFVGGSLTGGLKETQLMINFASKHNITSDVDRGHLNGLREYRDGASREGETSGTGSS